jgi:hypothetical protein
MEGLPRRYTPRELKTDQKKSHSRPSLGQWQLNVPRKTAEKKVAFDRLP